MVTCQVSGQQSQLVGWQRDLLRHADGVSPAGAAGERLQGAGWLATSPKQQARLLRLLLLHQVLGVSTAQRLEVKGKLIFFCRQMEVMTECSHSICDTECHT